MKYKGISRCLRDLSWQLIRIIIRQEVNINIIDKSNSNKLTVKDLWQPTITLAKNGISGAKDKKVNFKDLDPLLMLNYLLYYRASLIFAVSLTVL